MRILVHERPVLGRVRSATRLLGSLRAGSVHLVATAREPVNVLEHIADQGFDCFLCRLLLRDGDEPVQCLRSDDLLLRPWLNLRRQHLLKPRTPRPPLVFRLLFQPVLELVDDSGVRVVFLLFLPHCVAVPKKSEALLLGLASPVALPRLKVGEFLVSRQRNVERITRLARVGRNEHAMSRPHILAEAEDELCVLENSGVSVVLGKRENAQFSKTRLRTIQPPSRRGGRCAARC